MAFDVETTPSISDPTLQDEYIRLRDNDKALRLSNRFLGGSFLVFYEDTSYVDGDGPLFEMDGTDAAGRSIFLEITGVCELASPSTNVLVRLINVTDANTPVASSEVTITNPGITRTRGVSSALSIPTAAKIYKWQIRGTTGAANKVSAVVGVYLK